MKVETLEGRTLRYCDIKPGDMLWSSDTGFLAEFDPDGATWFDTATTAPDPSDSDKLVSDIWGDECFILRPCPVSEMHREAHADSPEQA